MDDLVHRCVLAPLWVRVCAVIANRNEQMYNMPKSFHHQNGLFPDHSADWWSAATGGSVMRERAGPPPFVGTRGRSGAQYPVLHGPL